jgi:Uma2 family endonuclease
MTAATTQPQRPHPKRWTKREFNKAVERGWFSGTRIHLYRGELIEMPAQGHLHVRAVSNATSAILSVFEKPMYVVRIQAPFEVAGESMPEPDLAVCTAEQSKRLPHPDSAVLLIEISDTSHAYDHQKALDYAAAGVPDYWIVDVNGRCVKVFRDPRPDSTSETGFRYADFRTLQEGEVLSPLAKPTAEIGVSDLLP